jgi:hypothetical protein
MMDSDQVSALLAAVTRNKMLSNVLAFSSDLILALVASRAELAHANISAHAARLVVRNVMADKPPGSAAEWIARIDAFIAALPPSILCPHCKLISYQPEDVANRYCGHCHVFHEATPP